MTAEPLLMPPKDQLLKIQDVLNITKLSKPALYRTSLASLRIKIGRASFWSEIDVFQWIVKQRNHFNGEIKQPVPTKEVTVRWQ
jgi:predicted DNA-binding transcriptional regulator AlpA